MSNLYDNLVREGNYTGAIRLFARTQYESGKIGHTRMLVMVRVADENDELKKREEFYNKVCDGHYAEVAKMQSEIERLKLMVKSITGGLDEAIESNQYLGKELDKARETIDEINNRTVSFLECGPYETGVEALRLAQEIYKLSSGEGRQ